MNNNDELTFECGSADYVEVKQSFSSLPSAGMWKDREETDEELLGGLA